MLTLLVADLADALLGVADPPEVTVGINREFDKTDEIKNVVLLYREGLLEHGAAVRAVSVFVPTWGDEEIEAFIARELEPVPPPVTPPASANAPSY